MNKEEVSRRYYESIKPDIDRLIDRVADLPLLDKLLNMDKQTREDLFTHVYGGCCEFPQICELASHLDYCFIDDGEMSLVYVKFKIQPRFLPEDMEYIEMTTSFVYWGECYYYTDKQMLDLALTYHGRDMKKNAQIVEWCAIPMWEEELQWCIDTLVHEKSGNTCDLDEGREWHDENDRFDEMTKDYIISKDPKQERYKREEEDGTEEETETDRHN